MAEAEAQADAMRRQLSQLRLENERLQMEQTLLEKLLVVRDAILSVVVQLDTLPPSQQQQGQAAQQGANGSSILGATARPSVTALLEDPAALQAASQQLAAALGELPSLEQMEQMVAQMGGDSTPEGGASSGSSGGSGSSAAGSQAGAGVAPAVLQAEAAVAPPLSAAVGAAAASGVVVERSRLQEAVPLPSAAAEREAEVGGACRTCLCSLLSTGLGGDGLVWFTLLHTFCTLWHCLWYLPESLARTLADRPTPIVLTPLVMSLFAQHRARIT